jgi:hypothetical protein
MKSIMLCFVACMFMFGCQHQVIDQGRQVEDAWFRAARQRDKQQRIIDQYYDQQAFREVTSR